MPLVVNVFTHLPPDVLAALQALRIEVANMSQQLTDLQAAVASLASDVSEETTVVESAIVMIDGLRAQIVDASASATDLADLQARLVDLDGALDTNRTKLANAVQANTTPPVVPVPVLPEP